MRDCSFQGQYGGDLVFAEQELLQRCVAAGIQTGDDVLKWHAGYDVELGMDSSDDITYRLTFGARF